MIVWDSGEYRILGESPIEPGLEQGPESVKIGKKIEELRRSSR